MVIITVIKHVQFWSQKGYNLAIKKDKRHSTRKQWTAKRQNIEVETTPHRHSTHT